MRILIVAACVVGLVGEYGWVLISPDFWYLCIRICLFLCLSFAWFHVQGWVKRVVEFTWGCALYGVIKEVFLNPLKVDGWDYAGVMLGLFILIIQLCRKR